MTQLANPSMMAEVAAVRPGVRPLSRSKKALFASVVVIGLLLTAEALVRVRDWIRFGSVMPSEQIYLSHPRLGKVPKPGAALHGSNVSISINSLGFRGPNFAPHKPPGTFRIACLGGSTTFGLYCADDETWPAQLENLVRDSCPDRRIEVINAGVPGYTLSQSLINFRERVVPLAPDLVVIYHAPNDLSYEQRRAFGNADQAVTGTESSWPARWLSDHSLLYRKVAKNIQVRWGTFEAVPRQDDLPDRAIVGFRDRLVALVEECRGTGTDVVLCTVATQYRPEQPRTRRRRAAATALYYNQHLSLVGLIRATARFNLEIERVAHEKGVPRGDVYSAVPGDADHFVDSVHFTAQGAARVAKCLYMALLESGCVPQ